MLHRRHETRSEGNYRPYNDSDDRKVRARGVEKAPGEGRDHQID